MQGEYSPRQIAITNALPYANGDIHLGHLVEVVQSDIWARYQRMQGHEVLYVCGDDAHGTPVMLRAEQEGVSPEDFIEGVNANHCRDFDAFAISFDHYYTTHSAENRELVTDIYNKVQKHIEKRSIFQLFDTVKQVFLSDRYVQGTCPRCQAVEQYGDHCEHCGATYSAEELIDPVSMLSGSVPESRKSEHYFFDLPAFTQVLRDWIGTCIKQEAVANKLDEWLDEGLLQWDISRDAPYFGFTIPGTSDKYFYVWLDAPVGYMASQLNYLKNNNKEEYFKVIWEPDSEVELYHFIGKDISNFHTLFWPALLHAAQMRMPTGVFVHGFLTVNGEKMSKSKGTFILAGTYSRHLDPEYLRYFFASRLGPSIDDIDLNLEDFAQQVNTDLVGKVVNIASRCAGFIHKFGGGCMSDELYDNALWQDISQRSDAIAHCYEQRQYHKAMREIMACADLTNQFVQEQEPWILAKTAGNEKRVLSICSQGLNLYRLLVLWLKPVLPSLAEASEALLKVKPMSWKDASEPLLNHPIAPFQALMQRITPEQIEALIRDSKDDLMKAE